MLLRHVIPAAIAVVPSIVLADNQSPRALPGDHVVQLEIAINRHNESGVALTANKTMLMSNGVQATTQEGIVYTSLNHKPVFTGLTFSASAYSATENVVAVHLSLSDSSHLDADKELHSDIASIASVADRWLSLQRGETVQMRIGEDDVALTVR